MTGALWEAIDGHAALLRRGRIADLFAAEADRVAAYTLTPPHLTIDLSKERFDARAKTLLLDLARAQDLEGWRHKMFAGEIVNTTEKRAVLHTALRGRAPTAEIGQEIATVRTRMEEFGRAFRAGRIKGATGEALNAIIHIGIGGSELGPVLLVQALKDQRAPGIEVRFAANIDGAEIADAIEGLDAASTLVIVVSKTFTTLETLANANAARDWLREKLGREDVSAHLVAVTAAVDKARLWGATDAQVFPFWDFVGGRYSLWSAVSLSAVCALKDGAFTDFLAGAAEMDEHFDLAPLERNAPVLDACVHVFNRALGTHSYVCAPYSRRLARLPAYLQQLEMESNGKRVTRDGEPLTRAAAGVTWGEPGTNAQHSFFQLLHQGVEPIPVEFVLVAAGHDGPPEHRTQLLANALAQAQALMAGDHPGDPQRTFLGDRPSTIIALDTLTPRALGALLAFYEHRTFTQGVMLGINSFDQFGVELGKKLAGPIAGALNGEAPPPDADASTKAWIERLRVAK